MTAIDLFWILVFGSVALAVWIAYGGWAKRTQKWSGIIKSGMINKDFGRPSPIASGITEDTEDEKTAEQDQMESSEEFNKRFDD